ncbi:MAG: TIGR03643 family protein [Phormidesmis sp.]
MNTESKERAKKETVDPGLKALKEAEAKGFKIKGDSTQDDWTVPERPDVDKLDSATIDRVLEMAWEDRTTFDVIEQQFGLKEQDVIEVMRKHMKRSSFKMWRKRVSERKTKHAKKRDFEVGRFKSSNQKNY